LALHHRPHNGWVRRKSPRLTINAEGRKSAILKAE
jgi:hypothetical protein